MEWQPIETAPTGKNGIAFMYVCYGPGEDKTSGQAIRIDNKFFMAGICYCIGNKEKPFEMREIEVSPTHWMQLPDAPSK